MNHGLFTRTEVVWIQETISPPAVNAQNMLMEIHGSPSAVDIQMNLKIFSYIIALFNNIKHRDRT